ncbi:hypothetical protein [uncultured Microbacterium sp.]|uniref:hypothetical protein n=1 Tax=uncultured Microbacterium sp. TaxID=191216 RepID=UPI0035CB27F8
MSSRILRVAASAVIAAALWAGPVDASRAADPAPDATSSSTVSVSVPTATPAPSTPATTIPPLTSGSGGAPASVTTTTTRSSAGGGSAPVSAAGTTSTACVPKQPAVPTVPATGGTPASVDKPIYAAGDTVNATATGFGAAEQVQLVFFDDPTLVGSFTADAAGAVTAQFSLAADTLAGTHALQFTGWCGVTSTAELLIGTTNGAASAGPQGVPPWLWWIGGGLGAILLALGAWWAIRTMRAPLPVEAAAA